MVGFKACATVALNRRHRHGAEEVEGRWALELPTIGVLFEGEVKLLLAKDGLAENSESQSWLPVDVVTTADQVVCREHDRSDIISLHVGEHATFAIRFLLREKLHKRVQVFVHPPPTPLVGVHDHGEPAVAHLMDDHADQAVFCPLAAGAALFRSWALKRDHRIPHASDGTVDGDDDRIGIVKHESRVDASCVGNRGRRVLPP